MKKLAKIVKELDLDCKIARNRVFGFMALCFTRKQRIRDYSEIKRALDKAGYNSCRGEKNLFIFKKKKLFDANITC